MVTNDDGRILLDLCRHECDNQLGHLSHPLVHPVSPMQHSSAYFTSSPFPTPSHHTVRSFPIHSMTPIWIFPAYPLLITAPFASNIIDAVPTAAAATRINAIAIALTAVSIQGAGFMVSIMIYSAFIYRLMTRKLPNEPTRPGIFVSVGPSGFTVAGIVHLANDLKEKIVGIDEAFGSPNGVVDASFVLKILADVVGLWLWGLCIWYDYSEIITPPGLMC